MSTDKRLKISIAMATYNGGKYLQEQLDSFLAQTRLPDELVITDDCSTDNTLEIIQAFAATAPFEVRWEQNEKNLGYAGNFNQALMKTMGDLVFLSDQDDVWFPEKLARSECYALNNPKALVIMNDAELTDGQLNPTGLTKQGQIASAGMPASSFVMGCCAGVNRKLLDYCLPIPSGFRGHDNWIVGIAHGLSSTLVVDDVLQFYRRHETNASGFIANSTIRATRMMRYQNAFTRIVNSKTSRKTTLNEFCTQMYQVRAAVRNIENSRDAVIRNSAKRFGAKLEEKILAIEKRISILDKPRIKRLLPILRLWLNADYEKFAGFLTAMRDIASK